VVVCAEAPMNFQLVGSVGPGVCGGVRDHPAGGGGGSGGGLSSELALHMHAARWCSFHGRCAGGSGCVVVYGGGVGAVSRAGVSDACC
jgi:hypothetical protein